MKNRRLWGLLFCEIENNLAVRVMSFVQFSVHLSSSQEIFRENRWLRPWEGARPRSSVSTAGVQSIAHGLPWSSNSSDNDNSIRKLKDISSPLMVSGRYYCVLSYAKQKDARVVLSCDDLLLLPVRPFFSNRVLTKLLSLPLLI